MKRFFSFSGQIKCNRSINTCFFIFLFRIKCLNDQLGSRRPSLASVHSTSSSIKSYSAIRFEKELQQKEIRQEMKLRLTRLQQQQQLIQNKPHIIITDPHVIGGAIPKTIALKTPSPLTPNSLDELLPCVIETAEVSWRLTHLHHSNWI